MDYIKNPMKIEEKSFEIIQEIIDEIRPEYKFKNEIEEEIIKRAIHTTADFDYLDILKISENAIDNIKNALENGATIYTDTTMALSGINKHMLEQIGCKYSCLISDSRTVKLAKEKGITRSMAAVEVASKESGDKVFVFGNAPTAVYKAIELHKLKLLKPSVIIGVPVGFVGAEDSKNKLYDSEIECIISKGRKGGSNLAAAIINAILYYYFK
ncbi:cobalt-precorrin-8 methylmutase [Peptostreptococcus canis]|uniref:Cobalt-precorrin-8 methylmutase n=1 Tax=Peptostreptococcus canis TaxID=1159213 RepID=A0ABR6TIS1_9FIRM|nr:cobalt-precorrin-8 methylmutase [Peptostreptococcus canis]MBC2575300.1 cobalt-precorrin-8 methylmutase [Peptostreptococcus canis]